MKNRITRIGKELIEIGVEVLQFVGVLFLALIYSPFLVCLAILFPIAVLDIFATTGRIDVKEAWQNTLCCGRYE